MEGDALRTGVAALLDLLLPRTCAVCGRLQSAAERELVCGHCWTRARELPYPRCARCGHPISYRADLRAPCTDGSDLRALCTDGADLSPPPTAPDSCRWCEMLPPYVRSGRSAFAIPGGSAESIVHALKYRGWPAIARAMARRMGSLAFPDDVVRERSALVPVPLAPARRRERGYNQSTELARALGEAWRLPVREDVLERVRATATQTRLTPGERHRNVSGAFRARADRASLRGRHFVLVDDVVTTAATLNACAAALHAGGARILSFVTFGRAPALGDRW